MPWAPIARACARPRGKNKGCVFSRCTKASRRKSDSSRCPRSRRDARCNALIKPASLCAFRQPRAVVVEVSACTLFFASYRRRRRPPPSQSLPDIGFWISRIRFQMPEVGYRLRYRVRPHPMRPRSSKLDDVKSAANGPPSAMGYLIRHSFAQPVRSVRFYAVYRPANLYFWIKRSRTCRWL